MLIHDLEAEEQTYGDIVRIEVAEGTKQAARVKTWHVFNWTVLNCPEASLIFKQDYDTIVDWRVFLPRLFNITLNISSNSDSSIPYPSKMSHIDPEPALLHLYLGRKHFATPCGSGALYGFSRDIARWVVSNVQPLNGTYYEDLAVCSWVNQFEKDNGHVNRNGLLKPEDFLRNASIHFIKSDTSYFACFENRYYGCGNGKPQGTDGYEFFRLPPRNSSAVRSSYLGHADSRLSFGDILAAISITQRPRKIVEFGILDGFSLKVLADTCDPGSTSIEAYDLFENFTGNHAKAEIVQTFKLFSHVSIKKGDLYTEVLKYEDFSIDLLHIDISNNGNVYEFAFTQCMNKVSKASGVLLLEGGSEERDRVTWMQKYGKPKMAPVVQKYQDHFSVYVFEKFPSMTMVRWPLV